MRVAALAIFTSALIMMVSIEAKGRSMGKFQSAMSNEHVLWLQGQIKDAKTITPGCSRETLMKVFEPEAGLQSKVPTRYVLRTCPLIKIEVKFAPVQTDRHVENEDNLRVASVSALYLDYVVCD